MSRRAVVLIQGINDNSGYLLPAVKESNFTLDQYDKKVYINSEKYFDKVKKSLPFYLAWIPSKQKDYLADLWGFFVRKDTRKQINKEVIASIRALEVDGYEIDIIGHSLGTLIALTCGNKKNNIFINNYYCLNTPLGIESPIARFVVQRTVKKYNKHFKCKNLYNLYGTGDYISSKVKKSQSILESQTINYIEKSHDVGDDMLDSHSATHSLNLL